MGTSWELRREPARGIVHQWPPDPLSVPEEEAPGLGINGPDVSVLVALWIYATAAVVAALAVVLALLGLAGQRDNLSH